MFFINCMRRFQKRDIHTWGGRWKITGTCAIVGEALVFNSTKGQLVCVWPQSARLHNEYGDTLFPYDYMPPTMVMIATVL